MQQNRPLNTQNAADALQKFNLKKTAVQKALDSLADGGKISFKEYGKQKIYIARQDQFEIPNSEELAQMKEENAKLQDQLQGQKKAISEVESGIGILQKERQILRSNTSSFLSLSIDSSDSQSAFLWRVNYTFSCLQKSGACSRT